MKTASGLTPSELKKPGRRLLRKNLKSFMDIYNFVDNRNLFGELDFKAIEYCKRVI
jgi:hypothetical protein